jgi:hypothetical protein
VRPAAGPVLPPLAARRAADPGVATWPSGREPAGTATLAALTDAASPEALAGTGAHGARTPAAPRDGAPLTISDAARALASLVEAESPRAAVAASVRVDAPLLAEAPDPGQASRLSGALARVVERSGLFYEAHQAQWIAGERDATELKVESSAIAAAPAAGAESRVAAQLALLDTGVLRLAFAAWPGQPAELEILDPRKHASPAEPPAPTWRMTLDLATPALGKLRVTFALQAGVLTIAVGAEDAQARDDISRALPLLRRVLAAHDVALSGIVVADDHA